MQNQNTKLLTANPDVEKFLKNVNIPQSVESCWEWKLYRFPNGYGCVGTRKYKTQCAHRVSYLLFNGNIQGKHVLHSCDNPPCVNPAHLWLGSDADNARDKCEKGRHIARSGEQSGQCKYTNSKILDVFQLRNEGNSHSKISKLTGISKSHVGQILRKEKRQTAVQRGTSGMESARPACCLALARSPAL